MLLSRYNNIDYINNMEWTEGIDLINKAIEKTREEKEWDMWVSIYPNMDKKTFISFDKFRSKKTITKNNMTKSEILQKAEEIKQLHQGTHKGVRKE